jgi:predicted phage terminase large subunit-like protein
MPKSFTFIPSKLSDNEILMTQDPSYKASLLALPRVERERLLGGNWNVRRSAGCYFNRKDFEIIDVLPEGAIGDVRYWDKASTKPNEQNKDPDYTAGLRMHRYRDGTYVVSDVRRLRDAPAKVEAFVKKAAKDDGYRTKIYVEQEPGSSGQADVDNYIRLLAGYPTYASRPTNDKITRALPVSAYGESGKIKLLRGSWNEPFLKEIENFPPEEGKGHDDQVDVFSGAFNELCGANSSLDVL